MYIGLLLKNISKLCVNVREIAFASCGQVRSNKNTCYEVHLSKSKGVEIRDGPVKFNLRSDIKEILEEWANVKKKNTH